MSIFINNPLPLQLILELCKGSARGSVDFLAIQNYLDKLPMTSANTDVSKWKLHLLNSEFSNHYPRVDLSSVCVSTGIQR